MKRGCFPSSFKDGHRSKLVCSLYTTSLQHASELSKYEENESHPKFRPHKPTPGGHPEDACTANTCALRLVRAPRLRGSRAGGLWTARAALRAPDSRVPSRCWMCQRALTKPGGQASRHRTRCSGEHRGPAESLSVSPWHKLPQGGIAGKAVPLNQI